MLFASFALGVMLPTQPLGRRLGAASPKVVLEAYVDCEPTALPSATARLMPECSSWSKAEWAAFLDPLLK